MPDYDKPAIAAAVYEGVLTIKAQDATSEIASIYVNGEEFINPLNGVLAIKLQQFDANLEFFTVQAKDTAGNASDVYKLQNPYYVRQVDENGELISVPSLPTDVKASGASEARGTVTEYAYEAAIEGLTDTSEEAYSAISSDAGVQSGAVSPTKEFYTITVDSGKTFYLIIDHTKADNNVYFLTEVSENDLLNVTGTNYQTLEQNAAVVESSIPGLEAMSPEEIMAKYGTADADGTTQSEQKQNADTNTTSGTVQVNDSTGTVGIGGLTLSSQTITYIAMGVIAVLIIVVYYFAKIRGKKKHHRAIEPEETADIDNEEKDESDDFFKQSDY